jgi:hypothetical protein
VTPAEQRSEYEAPRLEELDVSQGPCDTASMVIISDA